MKHVANQFRRMLYENNVNDGKLFLIQQFKLKEAVMRLKVTTENLVRVSARFQAALLGEDEPPETLN